MFWVYLIKSPKFRYWQVNYVRSVGGKKVPLKKDKSISHPMLLHDEFRREGKKEGKCTNQFEWGESGEKVAYSFTFRKFGSFIKRKKDDVPNEGSGHMWKSDTASGDTQEARNTYSLRLLSRKGVVNFDNFPQRERKNIIVSREDCSYEWDPARGDDKMGRGAYVTTTHEGISLHECNKSVILQESIKESNRVMHCNHINDGDYDERDKLSSSARTSRSAAEDGENSVGEFLETLYRLIEMKNREKRNAFAQYIWKEGGLKGAEMPNIMEEELRRRMSYFVEEEKDMKVIFLLLHTLNKLLSIDEFVEKLHDKICKIHDSELLSIILRVLINALYRDKKFMILLLDKIKESIQLGTCTTLAISNTFYCYATLFGRNLICLEQVPLQEITQIMLGYYGTFSVVQLCEVVDLFRNFTPFFRGSGEGARGVLIRPNEERCGRSCQDGSSERGGKNGRDGRTERGSKNSLQKNLERLFLNVGNHFMEKDVLKMITFDVAKKVIYAYAKSKIHHEKLFLYLLPPLLKYIKERNQDTMRNRFYSDYVANGDKENKGNTVKQSKGDHTDCVQMEKQERCSEWRDTNRQGDIQNGEKYEYIMEAVESVTDILYAYSKFNIYIDELYNEILLFLQHHYGYMNCSNLSQCLISLTKVSCNVNILLSKVHYHHFNSKGKSLFYFQNCTPIDLMNFLLAFSKNMYAEREVYDILAELFTVGGEKQKKLNSLQAIDLINIIHAFSKIYYIHNKLFVKVENVILERLYNNTYYLTPEEAIKYVNACAKLCYRNENVMHKMVEVIHKNNFHHIKIYDLFKLLKSVKKLNLPFDSLETHIKMIAPNFTFDSANYTNHYYRIPKDLHVRKKKWVW
ncbi:conserved Plasmodium protein, unknown function [Plasmodium ovale]|uniref:Uncharacterized protein n=1 Tax=Plasmodium ovale TaxID=36330 RepID=A0A1D3U7L0_PLAOA|nr:conserved Plasmodium protein, unknown function [Plasmodium ovale]